MFTVGIITVETNEIRNKMSAVQKNALVQFYEKGHFHMYHGLTINALVRKGLIAKGEITDKGHAVLVSILELKDKKYRG